MEKLDIREKFLKYFNEENNTNLKEFEISKNMNYMEWLEKKIMEMSDTNSGLWVTDKPIPELFSLFFEWENSTHEDFTVFYHEQQFQLENKWAEWIKDKCYQLDDWL